MKYSSGMLLSEMVTAVLIAAVCLAVVFGIYVSGERDDSVESAKATIEAVRAEAKAADEDGGMLVCDNSLLDADLLANDFLTLSIKPTPIDGRSPDEGYGVGVHLVSNKKSDSGDTFDTAERLYKSLRKEHKEELRDIVKEDDDLEFSILLTERANCKDQSTDAKESTKTASSLPDSRR